LCKKVAEVYGKKLGRTINPFTEVLITSGANAALDSYILALINEGDELVLFEPCFPCYLDHVRIAGGVIKSAPLEFKDGSWRFDPELLRKALGPKTKIIILNTPHNPTGKVFTREELEQITEILKDFPHVVVISDEVYDFLTFDGKEHVRFATIGDNYAKTVSIYSGGKLFNCTGWKIGWAIGPEYIIRLGGIIANTVTYCLNTPGQVAFARCLDKASELY